jgi:arsenate reductase-like glutaredoxin family protein
VSSADVMERDLIRQPLSRDEVEDLVRRAGGLEAVLATRSPAYRARAAATAGEEAWISAMVEEPRLIRRPILETDRGMAVGFSAERWRGLLD